MMIVATAIVAEVVVVCSSYCYSISKFCVVEVGNDANDSAK